MFMDDNRRMSIIRVSEAVFGISYDAQIYVVQTLTTTATESYINGPSVVFVVVDDHARVINAHRFCCFLSTTKCCHIWPLVVIASISNSNHDNHNNLLVLATNCYLLFDGVRSCSSNERYEFQTLMNKTTHLYRGWICFVNNIEHSICANPNFFFCIHLIWWYRLSKLEQAFDVPWLLQGNIIMNRIPRQWLFTSLFTRHLDTDQTKN